MVSLSLMIGSSAGAQVRAALDVGGGLGGMNSGSWASELRFAPTVRATNRAGFVYFEGLGVQREGQLSLRRSTTQAALFSPAFGVFRLSLAGHHTVDRTDLLVPSSSADLSTALSARVGKGGLWFGARSSAGLAAGGWRIFGRAIVSLSAQDERARVASRVATSKTVVYMDSVYTDTSGWNVYPVSRNVSDTSAGRVTRRWSDMEARVDWAAGRIMMTAALSGRRSMDSLRAMMWGRVNAAVQLSPRLAFVAGGGTAPSARAGATFSRFATLGFRLSPAALLRSPLPAGVRPTAAAFALRPTGDGAYRITVRVPSARTVELSGDFNGWSAVAMHETSPDVWQIVLPLAPGTHHINLRVDGDRWTAPPGVAAVDDEFNGRVGIIVVQ